MAAEMAVLTGSDAKITRMDVQQFRELLSPSGQEVLHAAMELAPREAGFLGYFQTLSRSYTVELARAALEIAILRGEAAAKFPFAELLYFTRPALEQATSWEVAVHRSQRYKDYPRVLDLGCSVGGDTMALAEVALVIGVDREPLRLAMAQANLQVRNQHAAFIQADLLDPLPFEPGSSRAVFFDPARRTGERRHYTVERYSPPLSVVEEWTSRYPALGVKLSPGVALDEISVYQAELEFISLRGELKEANLWFGPLRSTTRRATILPGAFTLTGSAPLDIEDPLPANLADAPGAYLYEPDPAILRAGLVRTLGERLDAQQLDPSIAYLSAQHWQDTPFARAWNVEAWFPFSLKRLRAYLRAHNVGKLVVKKRGSPLQPEEVIHAMRLSGEFERVVFLTQLQGRPIAIIAREVRT